MKCPSLTGEVRWKLRDLSDVGVPGIPGVGVKSVDIRKNTCGEGEVLGIY